MAWITWPPEFSNHISSHFIGRLPHHLGPKMAVKCSQKELLFPCVRWYLPHQDLSILATKKRLKDEKPMRKETPIRSFKSWPFLSPKWKPLILWKGHLTIQNEVTKNCQEGKTHTNILHQTICPGKPTIKKHGREKMVSKQILTLEVRSSLILMPFPKKMLYFEVGLYFINNSRANNISFWWSKIPTSKIHGLPG